MKKRTIGALGLALGTGLGIMCAPKKGKELRKDVKDKVCDFKEEIKEKSQKITKEKSQKV